MKKVNISFNILAHEFLTHKTIAALVRSEIENSAVFREGMLAKITSLSVNDIERKR